MSEKQLGIPGCQVLPAMESANDEPLAGDGTGAKQQPKKTGGRFTVLNTFVDFAMGGLSRANMAVWLVLYRDTKDGIARTGQTDIARRAGVCTRTVKRAIRQLEQMGLVTVVRRGGLNSGVSSYRVRPLPKDFDR